jgi:hypothetical protein
VTRLRTHSSIEQKSSGQTARHGALTKVNDRARLIMKPKPNQGPERRRSLEGRAMTARQLGRFEPRRFAYYAPTSCRAFAVCLKMTILNCGA